MNSPPNPVSLVAERAVRLLRKRRRPMVSRVLARELLATETPDEATATGILKAAFSGDPRLCYGRGGWSLRSPASAGAARQGEPEPDRALIHVQGERRGRGRPFELASISALRLREDEVIAACGGDAVDGAYGNRLRRAVLETLDGAIPVIHDPPGALKAVEDWLAEALTSPISLRRLAQERVGLPATHNLETLVARLGLLWRETEDPLEQADILDACLQALRRPGESLQELRAHGRDVKPIDWRAFAFNREFLRNVPQVPGTYRFYDADGTLIYVGKSKNLHARIGSYFREDLRSRPLRVQRLLDSLHRIEYEAAGSDLEAMLREAELIRRREPARNVQRNVRARRGRAARLRSILILEPAEPPTILRAYLIRNERLIARVGIGPRGGGLRRIERVLDDFFFSTPAGPTTVAGPDLDVEIVVRWLAANRESVVAFDPTDLPSSQEVIERLRWFLGQRTPFDPDGAPIFSR